MAHWSQTICRRDLAPRIKAGLWMDVYRSRHFSGLIDADGGVASAREHYMDDPACEVPFGFAPELAGAKSIAAIIHAYYPDVLPGLLEALINVGRGVDLFISTDTEGKRAEISALCNHYELGQIDIRLAPNRGRDIAPKLIAFRDVYENYDLFLHLHTKRSPHGGSSLANWNAYLRGTLLGTPQIVRSILSMFDDPSIGLVFPQHLFRLRKALRWGPNYDQARRMLAAMGIQLQSDWPLEFPSGSMFWGRCTALRPLLDLGLTFEDFPEELGQVDGTLAHAVERIMLHTVEKAGFRWVKTACRDLYPKQATVLTVGSMEDFVEAARKVFKPCMPAVPLIGGQASGARSDFFQVQTSGDGNDGLLRIIDLSACGPETRSLGAGISLWQRRDPVEAARWLVVCGKEQTAALPSSGSRHPANGIDAIPSGMRIVSLRPTETCAGETNAETIANAIQHRIDALKGAASGGLVDLLPA